MSMNCLYNWNHCLYRECQDFCPVVRIGSPHSLTRKRVLPPFGSQRGDPLLAGKGVRDPIPPKGQILWYSKYTIIPRLYDWNLLFQTKTTFEISISTFLRAGRAADGADESVEFCWIQTTRTRAFEEPQVSNKKTTDKNSYYTYFFIY
jgi:hypothetical protein